MPDGNYIAIIPKHDCRDVFWSLVQGQWGLRGYGYGIKHCPHCGEKLSQVEQRSLDYASAVLEHIAQDENPSLWTPSLSHDAHVKAWEAWKQAVTLTKPPKTPA